MTTKHICVSVALAWLYVLTYVVLDPLGAPRYWALPLWLAAGLALHREDELDEHDG